MVAHANNEGAIAGVGSPAAVEAACAGPVASSAEGASPMVVGTAPASVASSTMVGTLSEQPEPPAEINAEPVSPVEVGTASTSLDQPGYDAVVSMVSELPDAVATVSTRLSASAMKWPNEAASGAAGPSTPRGPSRTVFHVASSWSIPSTSECAAEGSVAPRISQGASARAALPPARAVVAEATRPRPVADVTQRCWPASATAGTAVATANAAVAETHLPGKVAVKDEPRWPAIATAGPAIATADATSGVAHSPRQVAVKVEPRWLPPATA